MQRHFPSRRLEMVMIGDRIYHREPDGWHLLDNQAHASTRERSGGSA